MSRHPAKEEVTSFPIVLGPKPKDRAVPLPPVFELPAEAPRQPPPVSKPLRLPSLREAPAPQAPATDAKARTDFALPKLPPPKLTVFGPQSREATTRHGSYTLGKVLGSGGLSTVYEATKEGADGFRKRLAVKRIHGHLAEDAKLIDLLAAEARLSSLIQHPNVCQVLDFVQDEAGAFIVMELLDGCTLLQLFRALRQEPERLADARHQLLVARIIAGAAEGLHAAHELKDELGDSLQVVHRDVTPHNLFVLSSGSVKVTDFGIARARNQVHHTATGMVKGKLAYMAPEQLQGAAVDRRADVFSLGAVMWELLTGERLFHRANEAATLTAIASADVPEPATRQAAVTPAIAAVVMRALRLEPAERFQDAREMSRALERALVQSGDSVPNSDVADWIAELAPTATTDRATVKSAVLAPGRAGGTPPSELRAVVVAPEVAPSNQLVVPKPESTNRPWPRGVILAAAAAVPCLALFGWLSAAPARKPTVTHPVAAAPAKPPSAAAVPLSPGVRPETVPTAQPDVSPLPPVASTLPKTSRSPSLAAAAASVPVEPARTAETSSADPAAARGSVIVAVSGAPSEIVVEGRTYAANVAISLPVGRHRLTVVRKADHLASREIEVTVKDGATSFVPITIVDAAPSASP